MVVAPLAIDLLAILALLVALGLILVSRQLAQALVDVVRAIAGKVPLVGRFIGKGADWVEQKIVVEMTDIANGLQGLIGAFWHALGNLLASIGNEIVALSDAFDRMVWHLVHVVRAHVIHSEITVIQRTVRVAGKGSEWTKTQLARIERTLEHPEHTTIGAAIRTIIKPMVGELGRLERWTLPRLRWLDHEVTVELPRDIATLRARDLSLSRLYARLWARIKGLDKLVGALAFSGAVAIALGRLGGGWIRCSNWQRLGRLGCRLPVGLLEDLLGLGVDILIVENLCEIAGLVRVALDEARPAIHGLFVVEGAALCGGRHTASPALPLRAAQLPPVLNAIAL